MDWPTAAVLVIALLGAVAVWLEVREIRFQIQAAVKTLEDKIEVLRRANKDTPPPSHRRPPPFQPGKGG